MLIAAVGVQTKETACCLLRWRCRPRGLLAACCGGGAGKGDCMLIAAVGLQAKETACCFLRWGCMRRRLLAASCEGRWGCW
jgi:hypothetical protein